MSSSSNSSGSGNNGDRFRGSPGGYEADMESNDSSRSRQDSITPPPGPFPSPASSEADYPGAMADPAKSKLFALVRAPIDVLGAEIEAGAAGDDITYYQNLRSTSVENDQAAGPAGFLQPMLESKTMRDFLMTDLLQKEVGPKFCAAYDCGKLTGKRAGQEIMEILRPELNTIRSQPVTVPELFYLGTKICESFPSVAMTELIRFSGDKIEGRLAQWQTDFMDEGWWANEEVWECLNAHPSHVSLVEDHFTKIVNVTPLQKKQEMQASLMETDNA